MAILVNGLVKKPEAVLTVAVRTFLSRPVWNFSMRPNNYCIGAKAALLFLHDEIHL